MKNTNAYDYAFSKLSKIVTTLEKVSNKELQFTFDGCIVKFYPYNGWHTGKSIIDGRGLKKLIKQIEG